LTLPGWGAIYCAPTEKVEFVAHAGAAPDASPPDSIFGEGGGAALADGWVAGVFAHVSGVVPAVVAFFAVGFLNGDGKRGDGFGFEIAVAGGQEIHLRDDEEAGQVGRAGI